MRHEKQTSVVWLFSLSASENKIHFITITSHFFTCMYRHHKTFHISQWKVSWFSHFLSCNKKQHCVHQNKTSDFIGSFWSSSIHEVLLQVVLPNQRTKNTETLHQRLKPMKKFHMICTRNFWPMRTCHQSCASISSQWGPSTERVIRNTGLGLSFWVSIPLRQQPASTGRLVHLVCVTRYVVAVTWFFMFVDCCKQTHSYFWFALFRTIQKTQLKTTAKGLSKMNLYLALLLLMAVASINAQTAGEVKILFFETKPSTQTKLVTQCEKIPFVNIFKRERTHIQFTPAAGSDFSWLLFWPTDECNWLYYRSITRNITQWRIANWWFWLGIF